MAGRGTSLGPLLIISAIDLLLCCLTAAVMLFLIFQPSQRADRSSVLLQDIVGGGQAKQIGEGERQAPIIIMVDNFGETNLVAKDASDYQVIASTSDKNTIYRSLGSVGPLRLGPVDPKSRFVAHIAVTRKGKLVSGNWECFGGAASSVTVEPSGEPPVTMSCPNRCISPNSPDLPGNTHLVLIPKADPAPVKVPNDRCFGLLDGESLEDVRGLAAKCGVSVDPSGREYSRPQAWYECLWTAFQESTAQSCDQNGSDRVAFWVDARPPLAPGQLCQASGAGKRE